MIKKQLWLRGVRTILNNLEIAEKYLQKLRQWVQKSFNRKKQTPSRREIILWKIKNQINF